MKKFVAFTVATLVTAGASIAMAQCPTCSGTAAPVFSSGQPMYSAPAAPVYSQPAYSAPVQSYDQSYGQPVTQSFDQSYSQPVAQSFDQSYGQPVDQSYGQSYGQPVDQSYSQPVYSGQSNCGCGSTGGEVVYGGGMVGGEATFTGGEFNSYGGDNSSLNVGSVINGETVVSVGDTAIVETTDPGQGGSADGNVIDGSVEPSPDGGEVVTPPTEKSAPAPEETEGDA